MSDTLLQTLRRDFDAGDYPSGARLVVEFLRRGLHESLTRPDESCWKAAIEYHQVDKALMNPILLAGWGRDGDYAEWDGGWIGKDASGYFVASGGCDTTGWDCRSGATLNFHGGLDELALHLDTDAIRGLIT